MKKPNHPKRTSILLFVMFFIGSIITIHAQDDQNEGTYIELKMHSASLENNFLGDSPDRYVSVYLPPGYYSSPEKHYPVIYFLHSYDIDHTSFFGGAPWNSINFKTICDKLISSGEIDPVIVVSPNSYNKYGGSHYTNSLVTGNWEDYIVQDVTHYMDRNFRTLPQSQSRGLAGHSMGGTGTILLVMHNPDIYNAAYSFSGWIDHTEKCSELKNEMIEASKATELEGLHWLIRVQIAEAAAYAPDTLAPPFYVQFAYNDSGELIDSVWQKWLQHDPLTLVPSYKESLLQLKALQFDCGINDYTSLVHGNRNFSAALTDLGIPHVFEEYEGDHSNKLAERIETKLLPFFNANLSDTMVGQVTPKLIYWQEIETKENFNLKETINLDTTIWNRDSVSYKIVSGDPKNLFSIDNVNHTIVSDTMMLDYEEKDAYDLLIEATHRNGQETVVDTANIFVRIENVLEPTKIFDATFEIEENSELNSEVGTVPMDKIENVPLSFRIIDGNINRIFNINSLGIIQVINNDSLDYESYQQFVLQIVMVETSGTRSRDTATIIINVLDVVSNAKNINSPEIEIYPNPVKDIVNVEYSDFSKCELSITSLTGKLILKDKMEGPKYQADLSSFSKGIYFITISSKDFVTIRKIIKL